MSACGSVPQHTTSSASIVTAPVNVAHTTRGDVGYRSLGRGPVLVLVMGYAGTMETWDPHFVDMLARHFRVIVFDNAGIGKTSGGARIRSIDAMADQASALLTSLRVGRVDVLGWSMGGLIAQALTVRHAAQVRRLVLCATFPGGGDAVAPSQKDVAALTGSDPQAAMAELYPADQVLAGQALSGSLAAYRAPSRVPAAVAAAQRSAVRAWFLGRDPAGREAVHITAPTLIADGQRDRLVAPANDQALAHSISGSRMLLFPDAGHAFLFQEGMAFLRPVEVFLLGEGPALPLREVRARFVPDSATLAAAGVRWLRALGHLTKKSTQRELARIDLTYADATGTFEDQMLATHTSGALGRAIAAFVDRENLVVRDILALGAQSGSRASAWTLTIRRDGHRALVALNVVRHLLGLKPVSTQTTPTTTTTVFNL